MKKYVIAVMVAAVALSVTSPAFANNGRGEGQWKKQFKSDRSWKSFDKEDDEDGNAQHRSNDQNIPDPCRVDSKTALNNAMKAAHQAFMDAKKAARLVRTSAIAAANGDQTKIDAAWNAYQTSFLSAWSTYGEAVYAAMKAFGSARAVCRPNPVVATTSPTPTPSVSAAPTPTPLPSYSMATVSTHNVSGSCWTVVNSKVYNLTSFISNHPGGSGAILSMCGVDASSVFSNQHGGQPRPLRELTGLQIGVLQ